MKKRIDSGFTLMEMLVVVAIIAILVAIAIPTFTNQLEKSRETTDLANVRAAYAQVMTAVLSQDTTSVNYSEEDGYYVDVDLQQKKAGWTLNTTMLNIGGIGYNDNIHWLKEPAANGKCRVYYKNDETFLNWSGNEKS